ECAVRTAVATAEIERAIRSVGDVAEAEVTTRRPSRRSRAAGRARALLPPPPAGDPSLAATAGGPRRRTMTIPVESQSGGTQAGETFRRARHVRIELARLDSLMNLIGELVIARGRLVQLTGTNEDSALTETV